MKKVKENLKEGSLIALLPLYGYIAAYGYGQGYFDSFGVPVFLLHVTLEETIIATISLVLLLIGLLFLIIMASLLFVKFKNFLHWLVFFVFMYLWLSAIFFILGVFVNHDTSFTIYAFLASIPNNIVSILNFSQLDINMLVLLLSSFLSILLFKKKLLSVSHKMFDNQILAKGILLLFLVFITYLTAHHLGYKDGITQNTFLVFQYENKEYALLKNYGDEIIGIGTDKKNDYVILEGNHDFVLQRKVLERE